MLHTTQRGGSLCQSLCLKCQTEGHHRSCRRLQAQMMLLSSASKAVSQMATKVQECLCNQGGSKTQRDLSVEVDDLPPRTLKELSCESTDKKEGF